MANRGQFVKGKSGNPKGRPKSGEAITDLFREYLEGNEEHTNVTRKQMLIKELYARAMGNMDEKSEGKHGQAQQGSDTLLMYIINRIDGLPRQSLDLDAFVEGEDALTVFIERPAVPRGSRGEEGRENLERISQDSTENGI